MSISKIALFYLVVVTATSPAMSNGLTSGEANVDVETENVAAIAIGTGNAVQVGSFEACGTDFVSDLDIDLSTANAVGISIGNFNVALSGGVTFGAGPCTRN